MVLTNSSSAVGGNSNSTINNRPLPPLPTSSAVLSCSPSLSPPSSKRSVHQQQQQQDLDHQQQQTQQQQQTEQKYFISTHQLSPPGPPPPSFLLHTAGPIAKSNPTSFSSFSTFNSSSSISSSSPNLPPSSSPPPPLLTASPTALSPSSPPSSHFWATLAPLPRSIPPRPSSALSQPSPTLPLSPPPTFSSSPPPLPLANSPRAITPTPPSPGSPTSKRKDKVFHSPDYPTEPPLFDSNHYHQPPHRYHFLNQANPKLARGDQGVSHPSQNHQQQEQQQQQQQPSFQGLGLVLEETSKDTSHHHHQNQKQKEDQEPHIPPPPQHPPPQRAFPQRLSLKHLPRAHIDPKTSLPSPPSSGHIRYPFSPGTGTATAATGVGSSTLVNEPSSPHSPSAKKANINPLFHTPLQHQHQHHQHQQQHQHQHQQQQHPKDSCDHQNSSSSSSNSSSSLTSSAATHHTHHNHLLQQKRPDNAMAPPAPPATTMPQYPSRQDSQHYRTHTHFQEPPNVSYYHPPSSSNGGATSYTKHQTPQQHQPPHAAASPAVQQHGNNLTREEIEEIEDRRRMQQQILRDKLLYAETHAPDPALTVKTTTNHGFALGAFDMSESLAIVEDLLDYFGENEGALDNLDETDQFNQAELMEAERNHLQRESLIRHLYDSEEDYIRTLIDMGRFYRQPMLLLIQQADHKKGTLSFGSGSAPKPIATKEEVQTLFGNLDELIRFHEGFRDALESRAKIWGPNQIISDILMEVIPNFKVYTKYYTNFHAALTTLDRIMRLPHYKKFQEQCVADNPPGTPSLHLMLATPLRRISMTREILCSICQATQSSHPDYRNLITAYELFCQVSEQTRLDRLHAQDQLALFDIQSSMVGFPEPIMIPNRRLVLRADLHKVDSSLALEPRTYYLMNDVLLYARFDPRKNIYTFKGMFDLLYTQVNNPEDNTTLPQLPNSIQIANAGRKQMIRCRSREEKNYWMETLKQAIEVVNNASDDPSAPLGDVLPLRKYATSIASDSTTTLATFAGQSSVQGGTGFNGSSSAGGPLSPMLSPPAGSSATMSGPIAPSLAGGVTNHSMRSRALSAFTNMTSTSSAGMDTQSLASSTDSQGRPKAPRKPNPQADFYGCSFGVSFDVNLNEDNMPANSNAPARSLSATLQSGNNVSTTSVGTTSSSGSTTGSSILQAGMRTQQPLGAMLAAIPEDKLTPKQRKAKEALAKAVEARRQARLKEEAKRGKAVSPSSASVHSNGSNGGNNHKDDASTRQVNPDFSSSFIPVKVRRDVVGK